MKIIFLDIDGVLNSHKYWVENPDREKSRLGDLDPSAIETLNRIVERTGAKIVLSSTWRKVWSVDEVSEMFKSRGYRFDNIIDKTPVLDTIRGLEIDDFLKSKGFDPVYYDREKCRKRISDSEIKNYIIIDDEPDMLYLQRKNVVVTSMAFGLTPEMEDVCVEILNKDFTELYFKN